MPERRRRIGWRLHPGLTRCLEQYAEDHQRTVTSIVEQALAEFLAIPIAAAWEGQGVELCPGCEQGLLDEPGKCSVCGWRRHDRYARAGNAAGPSR